MLIQKEPSSILKKHLNPELPTLLLYPFLKNKNSTTNHLIFSNFLTKLQEQHSFNIILYGKTEPDSKLLNFSGSNILNLINKINSQNITNLISQLDFYIGADLAIMQLFSRLNKPLIFLSQNTKTNLLKDGPKNAYFKIIHQFKLPFFANLLFNTFNQLLKDISTGNYFTSQKEKTTYLLLHSYRIVYLLFSKKEYLKIANDLILLEQKGLNIYPFYYQWSSIFKLFKFMLHKKINVVQATKIHFIPKICLYFLFKIKKSWLKIIFISAPLNSYISIAYYLSLYRNTETNTNLSDHILENL
jgi:hypothetical protein